jgi:hypothetical protein
MKIKTIIVTSALLTAGFATAQTSGPQGSGNGQGQGGNGQNERHVYIARLHTLNSRVAGHPAGVARFVINGDRFSAQVRMTGTPRNMAHVQHIHAADKCPTIAADTNHDGFVDVVEGIPAYGPILVPLDADLSSQAAGSMTFPMANNAGFYNYQKMTSLTAMLADLHAPDPDPMDAVVKLPAGEDLNLAGRHVVVHGVPASTHLPATVQTLHGLPAQATLPIACGEIVEVK